MSIFGLHFVLNIIALFCVLENDIDMQAFELLDEKTVETLIPSPGIRLKFWNKWRKYKEARALVNAQSITLTFLTMYF